MGDRADEDFTVRGASGPPPRSSAALNAPVEGGGTPIDEDAVGRRGLSSIAGQYRFNSGTAALLEITPRHAAPAPEEAAVADEHTFALTIEASGEVTPAQPDAPEADTEAEEADQ